jgi:hypothetical protein
MRDSRVNFQTAELAKEKGFEQNGSKCWVQLLSGDIIHNDDREGKLEHERTKYYLSQPTQAILQQWLLENHGLFVSVELAYSKWGRFVAIVEKESKDKETSIIALDGFTIFNKYEEAFEEGLFEALKLI